MIVKKRHRSSSWEPAYEVRVTSEKNKTTSIRFLQSSFEKITSTDYIELSLENGKLYMSKGDKTSGYKVSIDSIRKDGLLGGKIHSHDKDLYLWASKNEGIYNIVKINGDLYRLEEVREKGNY